MLCESGLLTYPFRYFKAIEFRQADVQQHHVGPKIEGRCQSGRAGMSHPHQMTGFLKQQFQGRRRIHVVIHDQYPQDGTRAAWLFRLRAVVSFETAPSTNPQEDSRRTRCLVPKCWKH